MQIRIDDIYIAERFRSLRAVEVERLADSIESVGLLNPITVASSPDGDSRPYYLIAGLHRLRACERLGWSEIDACEVDLDGLGAQLAEIDENLIRAELTPLEIGEHYKRRKEIYEHLYPETRQGSAGGRAKNGVHNDNLAACTFAEDAAQKTGASRRTVERAVARAGAIPEDVRNAIRDTPVARNGSELDALARLKPDEQRAVAARVKGGEIESVRDASKIGQGQRKTTVALNPEEGKFEFERHDEEEKARVESQPDPRQTDLEDFIEICDGKDNDCNGPDSNEWYTPTSIIEMARSVMGSIDLDPASCAQAQEVVRAAKWFGKEDDGLTQSWSGNVWLNPPYGRDLIDAFVKKALAYVESGNIEQMILLANNCTETAWWQSLAKRADAICFPAGRIEFWGPHPGVSGPRRGQTIFYLCQFRAIGGFGEFFKTFGSLGWTTVP